MSTKLLELDRRYFDAWHNHDADAIAAAFSENSNYTHPALPEPLVGGAAVAKWANTVWRYNVLNPSALLEGRRELLWQGWGKWTDERATAFRARPELLEAALQMMAAYRMFVAEITDERLALRLEAAIIQEIEKDPTRLADDGMHKCPRRNTEDPITIWNTCESKLHGLPETLSI